MRIRNTVGALLLGGACAACGGAEPRAATVEDLGVPEAMARGSAEARSHFPYFLERQAAVSADSGPGLVWIVMPPEGGDRDPARISLKDVTQESGAYAGFIAAAVKDYPEYPVGARVTFPDALIADWVLRDGSRTVGFFQVRRVACAVAGVTTKLSAESQQLLRVQGAELMLDQESLCAPYDPYTSK